MYFDSNYFQQDQLKKSICYICNNEYRYFLNKKNVVGIGCGYKVKNGFSTNELCIQVFVSSKFPQNKLNSQDLVPNFYNNIPTDIIESGLFYQSSFLDKIRPVVGGYGIGNEQKPNKTGSLGCLVTDGYNNYILSCNHVLANNNYAPLGTKIIQPSFQHGGEFNKDVIGILSKFIPINFEKTFKETFKEATNYSDCAIAKVIHSSLVSSEIALIGTPQGIIIPRLNEQVKKVGANSELTTGVITSINTTLKINCVSVGKSALFKNQIITTFLALSGDSGAVLLDKNNYILGIIISGTNTYTTCSPINYILKELNVTLINN